MHDSPLPPFQPGAGARRLRLRVLTASVLSVVALTGCAAGSQGVTTQEACANGASFDCTTPPPPPNQ